MVTGTGPGVIAELNVFATRPPNTVPAIIRHIHFTESYRLRLRSLRPTEHGGPLGVDLDTQEQWLSRIMLCARKASQFSHGQGGQLTAVWSGWPGTIAKRIDVPIDYLQALAATNQLELSTRGIVFTLTRQPLRK